MTFTEQVRLWILDDEGWRAWARDLVSSAYAYGTEPAQYLADALREGIADATPMIADMETYAPGSGGLYDDLIGRALAEVDWNALARDLLEE